MEKTIVQKNIETNNFPDVVNAVKDDTGNMFLSIFLMAVFQN
jgi:hypothetical protein